MPDPNPDKSDISDYLESSDVLDFDHPLVSQTAQRLTYGLKTIFQKRGKFMNLQEIISFILLILMQPV